MFRSCPVPAARVLNVLVLYIVKNRNILIFFKVTYNFNESIHKHIHKLHKHKSGLNLLEFLLLGLITSSALQTMCAKVGDSRAVLGRLDGSKWSDPTSESCESKQTLKHEIFSSLLGMSNGFFSNFASVFS